MFKQINQLIKLLIIAILSWYGYLLMFMEYLLLFYKNVRNFSKSNMNYQCIDDARGKISIVIAIKNEDRYIGKTITTLETSTIDKKNVEIILVDGGCQDNSVNVAKASAGVIPIIYTKAEASSTRGDALNIGFELITGSIVLFIRADTLLPPGYDALIRNCFAKDSNVLLATFKSKLYDPLMKSPMINNNNVTSNNANNISNYMKNMQLEYNYIQSHLCILKILEYYNNWKTNIFKLPMLHQGYCLRSNTYRQMKFNHAMVLEDMELLKKIRNTCVIDNTNNSWWSTLWNAMHCNHIVVLDACVFNTSTITKYMHIGIIKYIFLEYLSTLLCIYNFTIHTIYQICYVYIPKYTKWFHY